MLQTENAIESGGAVVESRKVRKHAIRSAMIVVALSAILVAGCEREPQGLKVRLSAAPQVQVRRQPAARVVPLRIAVAPVISPRESVGLYRPLLEYVSSRLDRPVDLLQRRDNQQLQL